MAMNSTSNGGARVLLGLLLSGVIGTTASASTRVEFSADSPGLKIGENYISRTVNGVTITAQGFTAEFDTAHGTSAIYGPYPTGDYIFGPTASGPAGDTGFGLLSQPLPGINVTGKDEGGQAYAPGFDNGLNGSYLGDNPDIPGPPLPKIDFAVFTFSSPVSVSQVIVDDVVNSDRSIWAAGGTAAPNFGRGLLNAFPSYLLQSSNDNEASDGEYTHNFSGFDKISYLIVGVPTPQNTVGKFGAFPTDRGYVEVFMVGLGMDFIPAVPEPGTPALLLAGFAFAAFSKKRLTRSGSGCR